MNKPQIRSKYLQRRRALAADQARIRSQHVLPTIQRILLEDKPSRIHIYLAKHNEVATAEIITWIHNRGDIQLFAPTSRFTDVRSALLTPDTSYLTGDFGVVVPDTDSTYDIDEVGFDAIIVPTVVFDTDGYRLGYGSGYYDRLLAAQPHAKKIGLAYELSKFEGRLPIEPHDIPLDIVVTERQTYVAPLQ